MQQVKVDTADMWPLLINSVRYALGRASYAPAEVADLVVKYREALEPWQAKQIAKEIEAELARWSRTVVSTGDGDFVSRGEFPNGDVWLGLVAKLRAP